MVLNKEFSLSTAEVEDQGRDQVSRKATASYLREKVLEPMADVLEEDEEREERRAIPAVDVDVSYGSFRISLKISDRETARSMLMGVGIGCGVVALGIGAFFLANPQRVINAVRGALETTTGLQVINVTRGSILVELLCNSEESFQSFMKDFETKEVERRLIKEFKRTGYKGELEVIIINKEEADKHMEKIRGMQYLTFR